MYYVIVQYFMKEEGRWSLPGYLLDTDPLTITVGLEPGIMTENADSLPLRVPAWPMEEAFTILRRAKNCWGDQNHCYTLRRGNPFTIEGD